MNSKTIAFENDAVRLIAENSITGTMEADKLMFEHVMSMPMADVIEIATQHGYADFIKVIFSAAISNGMTFRYEGLKHLVDDGTYEYPIPPAPTDVLRVRNVPKGGVQKNIDVSQTLLEIESGISKNTANWGDMTDDIVEYDPIRDSLTMAQKLRYADVPNDKLLEIIAVDAAKAEKLAVDALGVKPASTTSKPDTVKSSTVKPVTVKSVPVVPHDAAYRKYHSPPPVKMAAPITHETIMADLNDRDGFKVVGKKQHKPLTHNKKSEKTKTSTSAGWFFFSNNPILKEIDDWHLWDFDTTDEVISPIGWIRVGHSQFRMTKKSPFVHTRQPDGSWTHHEEVYINDSIERYRVSTAYLRWCLTPDFMRKGACPAE